MFLLPVKHTLTQLEPYKALQVSLLFVYVTWNTVDVSTLSVNSLMLILLNLCLTLSFVSVPSF